MNYYGCHYELLFRGAHTIQEFKSTADGVAAATSTDDANAYRNDPSNNALYFNFWKLYSNCSGN